MGKREGLHSLLVWIRQSNESVAIATILVINDYTKERYTIIDGLIYHN